jgi:hypothetical protein
VQKKRDDGLLESTYEVEVVESPDFVDGTVELEQQTRGSEAWFEETHEYAMDVKASLVADTLDPDVCLIRKDVICIQNAVLPQPRAVETDSPTHKRLDAVFELLKCLHWYLRHPHPAHAYEIGKAHMKLLALIESKQVIRGQKNIDALNKARVSGTQNSKITREQNKVKGYLEYYEQYGKGALRGVAGYRRVAKLHGDTIGPKYGIGRGYKTVERAVRFHQK